jgi:hypothetical protein
MRPKHPFREHQLIWWIGNRSQRQSGKKRSGCTPSSLDWSRIMRRDWIGMRQNGDGKIEPRGKDDTLVPTV